MLCQNAILEKIVNQIGIKKEPFQALKYRDGQKGGPVLLSTSQAGPGKNFSQPRAHFLVHLCIHNSNFMRNRIKDIPFCRLYLRVTFTSLLSNGGQGAADV